MTRKPKENPPARDYTGLRNYQKTSVDVEQLFTRMKRQLNLQIQRLDDHLHMEANLLFDKDLAKMSKELAAAVAALGQMYMKIEDKAKATSEAMTTDEKVAAVCEMVRAEGRLNRMKFLRAFRELDYELSKFEREPHEDPPSGPGDEPVPDR